MEILCREVKFCHAHWLFSSNGYKCTDIGSAIWCPLRTLLVVVFHSLETSIFHPENECRRLVGSTLIGTEQAVKHLLALPQEKGGEQYAETGNTHAVSDVVQQQWVGHGKLQRINDNAPRDPEKGKAHQETKA